MSIGAKVHEQLAKRAPRLDELAIRARWRAANRARLFRPGPVEPRVQRILDDLKRDGIAIAGFDELFGSTELYETAAADARRRADAARAEDRLGSSEKKPFLTKLHPEEFQIDEPYARIALHPSVLSVANAYVRMRTYLLAVDVWLTSPVPGEAVETQLWHRDTDDYLTPKLFVYFSDVTEADGPFCYAPRTHPLGDRRETADMDETNRTHDDAMARIVPESEWIVCTGRAGTVILADTCGYHKQLKPTGGQRLLMIGEYTSGTPFWPRPIEINCADPTALTREQRFALLKNP
jgi:hypothetical protein